VDWEAIEKQYRAGVLTVREIARQGGVSHTAINKRAKDSGWPRDLTAKVREAVSTGLVSTEVSSTADARRTEREIIEEAAHTVIARSGRALQAVNRRRSTSGFQKARRLVRVGYGPMGAGA
jgi:DNA-binding MurR/RpiR family transcriptional regulator